MYNAATSFIIIGLDDNREVDFSPEVAGILLRRKVFSGGIRHREIVRSVLPSDAQWITITPPLDKVFEQYKGHPEIIVFASGDPLFFGFANTIRRYLPQAPIRLFPTFNSLQKLAHRLVMPYDDMRIVSLTGRPWHELDRALIERAPKIGVLTDREHTPASIAARLLAYGYTGYRMYVGEHLGHTSAERIRTLTLEEAASLSFDYPNCLILSAVAALPPRLFGIPDSAFEHLDGRSRMITKMPVRLLSLSLLGLPQKHSLWDIGFCTGSVSIEAKMQFPHLRVTAFEVREEGRRLMECNSRRFGTPGILSLTGDFLAADLSALPRPDAVFIGGHGGKLIEIICRVQTVLEPGGTLVFNSVSAESKELFLQGVEQAGMQAVQSVRITVDNYNTIEILKAQI